MWLGVLEIVKRVGWLCLISGVELKKIIKRVVKTLFLNYLTTIFTFLLTFV